MKWTHDLSELEWTVSGWTPYVWKQQRSIESGVSLNAEIVAIPTGVPGSVQQALHDVDVIPDWNVGLESRAAEWVENRHWIFTTRIPAVWTANGLCVRLRALGLDYSGWILVNGHEAGTFKGTFVPHVFDLAPFLLDRDNTLQIVFDSPPRWLGQIGYTSQMREWKERYNYFWDWTARLVQIGIWDDLILEVSDGREITAVDVRTTADALRYVGSVRVSGEVTGGGDQVVRMQILGPDGPLRTDLFSSRELADAVVWSDLPVDLWWPNGSGDQPLYTVRIELTGPDGQVEDSVSMQVGFREVTWQCCEGAPAEADPWICAVNGRPIFLQGFNWTPILPNFADVSDDDYRRLLSQYRDMGVNMLRVWGGAFLEKGIFYRLCDELGILVWQEFPLSSSGLDNCPPEDDDAVVGMEQIARSYIERRRHHVSLVIWCGGNELQDASYRPLDASHPMLGRLAEVVAEMDPDRRFLPTSPSGPRFGADAERFGTGQHWDVHGPWHVQGSLEGDYEDYWERNDALFHSEIGAAGASSVENIRRYKGTLPETPGTKENPLWRRTSWWVEWPVFVEQVGREPRDLEEYVAWSQERQRRALSIAARSAKRRFPHCGGFLVWMGHDSFPCTANTSVIDFDGDRKPAAEELARIYRQDAAEVEESHA